MSNSIAHGLPRGSKSGIASPQTAQSTLAEALRSAGGIRDCAHRARVFARIATLLHRVGDAPAVRSCLFSALASARKIPEDCMRASVLAEIARAQARTREREVARTTLAKANACLPAMGGRQGRVLRPCLDREGAGRARRRCRRAGERRSDRSAARPRTRASRHCPRGLVGRQIRGSPACGTINGSMRGACPLPRLDRLRARRRWRCCGRGPLARRPAAHAAQPARRRLRSPAPHEPVPRDPHRHA